MQISIIKLDATAQLRRSMKYCSRLWFYGGCFFFGFLPLAAGQSPLAFRLEQVCKPPVARPRITNVQIVDLDRDGTQDVLVCDAQAQAVIWCRKQPNGEWEEKQLAGDLIAPAHATIVDLDQDGDQDVVISVMGNLYPDDGVIGSLVLLENDNNEFTKKVLLSDVRRVVDAQPADFDGDGDLDLAVAVFGYLRGQILWLENRGDNNFLDHELLYAPGTIHVPVADYDGDGDPDIAAIVSQDEEEAWGLENLGHGTFKPRLLWTTPNYDIGSAGLVKSDLDHDGDFDLLLPVGDNLEDSYSIPQPYHGCLWLENRGNWEFSSQRLATFPGTYAVDAADLDADGDEDVVLCSLVNDWDSPDSASVVWLENDGAQHFAQHTVAQDPIMLTTIACGDLNADDRPDIAAGGLHLFRPFDRLGRVSSWISSERESSASENGEGERQDASESVVESSQVPLPDLSEIDSLTRADLQSLREQVQKKVAAGNATDDDWTKLGLAYYAFGFFTEAKRCFQTAAKLDESSFTANFWYGVSLSRLAELESAIEQFQQTLTITRPTEKPQVWHEIGRCQLRLENETEAEQAFAAAGDFDHSLYQLAKLRIRAQRTREAAVPLNALAKKQRGTTELYLLNYRMALAMNDTRLTQTFRDRSEYNSQKMPVEPVFAVAQQVRNQYGVDKLGRRAEQLIQQKNWAEAEPLLERIVEAHQDKDAVLLLATVEIERGHASEATARLESLMEEQGKFAQGMYVLGKAYAAAGDTKRAQSLWEETAQLQSVGELHQQLAQLYTNQGNQAAAKTQQALANQATGIAGLRHANPAAAMKYFEQAVELDDSLATSWFYLGECRRFLGKPAEARVAYQKAHQLDPNHGRATAALKSISH